MNNSIMFFFIQMKFNLTPPGKKSEKTKTRINQILRNHSGLNDSVKKKRQFNAEKSKLLVLFLSQKST